MDHALRALINRWRKNASNWSVPEAACWYRAADDLCELLNSLNQPMKIPDQLCLRSQPPKIDNGG